MTGVQTCALPIFNFIGEEFEENPFLPLFYAKPEEFAFPLEFSFLLDRARQLKRLDPCFNYVSDYLIQKSLWFASTNLKSSDLKAYSDLFPKVASITPEPTLVVFLHLPLKLVKANIISRGRDYEKEINEDYLHSLNEKYLSEAVQIGKKTNVLNFVLASNSAETYDLVAEKVFHFMENLPLTVSGIQEFKVG